MERKYETEVGKVTEAKSLIGYRLGLYDPDPSVRGISFVGRLFRPTAHDRRIMASVIERFNLLSRESMATLCLGTFPVKR